MEWHYVQGGAPAGPVSAQQLDDLARAGAIRADTLVWRQGMAEWQSYATVMPKAPPVIGPGPGESVCVECGKAFPVDQMIRFESSWICAACKPIFFQRLREGGVAPAGSAVWRFNKYLIMRRDAALPDRCVKCNAPAQGQRLPRKLAWHSPYLYLLIPVALLLYALVAMIVQKKARIEVGLCDQHRAQRSRAILVSWLLALGGISLLMGAVVFDYLWGYLFGIILLLAGMIYGTLKSPVVSPRRIDDEFVWLKGVSKDYLRTLPEWPGRS